MPKTMKNKKIHNKKKQSKLARLVEKVEANRIKRGYPLRSSIKRKPLSNKDNLDILRYYNISANKKKGSTRKAAKKVLADKLCKCIKKLTVRNNGVNDGRTIGLCTKSVFERKGLERGLFTCDKERGTYLEVFKQ